MLTQQGHAQGGDFRFAKQFGGEDRSESISLASDSNGNFYITGYFSNTINLGGDVGMI